VLRCCSVHCTTQPGAERGQTLASAVCCANYSYSMSENLRCILELEHSPERGSVEVKYKARSLE